MSDSLHEALGAEYRRQLLVLNRERIEFAYVKAQSKRMDDPIILVLDLQDDGAARLAQLTGVPWEQIERLREECHRSDVVPAEVIAVPQETVSCVVGPPASDGPKVVAQPVQRGSFRVVAIASNGNSYADFPAPPVSCPDQE